MGGDGTCRRNEDEGVSGEQGVDRIVEGGRRRAKSARAGFFSGAQGLRGGGRAGRLRAEVVDLLGAIADLDSGGAVEPDVVLACGGGRRAVWRWAGRCRW